MRDIQSTTHVHLLLEVSGWLPEGGGGPQVYGFDTRNGEGAFQTEGSWSVRLIGSEIESESREGGIGLAPFVYRTTPLMHFAMCL